MEIRVNVLGKVAYIQGESRDNEAQVANEPLEDALLDCANYCILTLMEYQKRKEHGTD